MSFNEAIALQPVWVGIWLNILLVGAFILPLTLFIWRQSRMAAVLTLAAGILSAVGVQWLYGQYGYVKLLGLPHIIFWTPLMAYLWVQQGRADMPVWPRRITRIIMALIAISLVFDYVDVIRYVLGDRTASV